jgi:hypothetical protein
MPAYLPLVQVTRNGLNKVLNNKGGMPFDELFGHGARNFRTLRYANTSLVALLFESTPTENWIVHTANCSPF